MEQTYDNHGYSYALQSPERYTQQLTEFTRYSDEKRVIANYVNRDRKPADSILDIGAGNGELAKLIYDQDTSYTAIEQNPSSCENLRQLGFLAINGTFPSISPEKKFDVVLASHSVPSFPVDYEPFIDAAWEHTKTIDGRLILITFSDEPSTYADVMKEIGLPKDTSGRRIKELRTYLREKGELHEQQLTCRLQAPEIKRLIATLAFIGSTNGNLSKHQLITKTLYNNPKILNEEVRETLTFPLISHAFTISRNKK